MRSDGAEKWVSILSCSSGRLYHVLLSGLFSVSVGRMYVMDGRAWQDGKFVFRQYDNCVSRTKECVFLKYSVFTLSTNELFAPFKNIPQISLLDQIL